MNPGQSLFQYQPSEGSRSFYLLQNDVPLPSGADVICDMAGLEHRVNVGLLASFQVSEKEAQQFLEQKLDGAVQVAKDAFRQLESLFGAKEGSNNWLQQSGAFHQLTGTIMEMLSVEGTSRTDETTARPTEIDPGAFQLKVKEFMASSEGKDAFAGIAEKLRSAADQVERSGGKSDSIGDLITSLGKELLADLDPKKFEKEQEQRIKAGVEQSISDALNISGFQVYTGSASEE